MVATMSRSRFVGSKPLGFQAGDANLYRFVGNDPADSTDPSGLQQKKLPYPDKMGEINPPIPNVEIDIVAQIGGYIGASGTQPDRKGHIKQSPDKAIKPKTIPDDQRPGVSKPGNNIASGTHVFIGWPNKPGQFFGTGGCQGCVGVIIRCKGGYGAIFHFSAQDHPARTLGQYKGKFSTCGDCVAVVFGGDETVSSRATLGGVVAGLTDILGWSNVYFADTDHLHIGMNGEWYVRPPLKN